MNVNGQVGSLRTLREAAKRGTETPNGSMGGFFLLSPGGSKRERTGGVEQEGGGIWGTGGGTGGDGPGARSEGETNMGEKRR